MKYVQGEIFYPDGLKKGYIGFTNETLCEHGIRSAPAKPIAKGLIIPLVINAHTHIGDSFIHKKIANLPRVVKDLVAPPDGLKHRLLQTTSEKVILKGIQNSLKIMKKCGTWGCCDFREQGMKGVKLLQTAMKTVNELNVRIFSRPQHLCYEKEEIQLLLKYSAGIGVSSISDWDYSELKKIAQETKRKHKLFALHASETVQENIDDILDLHPHFLVHMIKASESDLIRVKENNIPIVLCPRSNAFFGLQPKFRLLKKTDVCLLLGSDNAMINPPNIMEELAYLKQITREFTLTELLNMITYMPRKVLNEDANIQVPTLSSAFIVVERKTLKPIYISSYKRGNI